MACKPTAAAVIVIEDNPDNLFIVMDLLKAELNVRYVNSRASGYQFFKLIASQPMLEVDLILLDIQIPYEDGYVVLKQIRSHPRLQQTKVVALTANVLPDDVRRARDCGFNGFIGKPIDADRFPEQIERILRDESVWEPR
ncbi:MAG: response regulator [Oscillochloris sp.]|nr:response regulator [Oscillochloris sp.]